MYDSRSKQQKKVLIVSFFFPPSNNIAAVRVGKFAKYLSEFGWNPTVLTVDNVNGLQPTLSIEIDEANIIRMPYLWTFRPLEQPGNTGKGLQNVPAKNYIWRKGLRGLTYVARPITHSTVMWILPLEGMDWFPYGVKKGLQLLKNERFDVIFSSFLPTVSHLIASRLHSQTKIPWVAEFRDLWARSQVIKNRQPFLFFAEQLEKRVMKGSDALITVSDPLARQLEALHSKKVITIFNGFDEEDYREEIHLTSRFTITYTGNVSPRRQDPSPLFQAIVELKQQDKLSPGELEVRFFGLNVLETISPLVKKYHLQQYVKIYGHVPFKDSIKRQMESTVLLLLSWNDPKEKGIYSGKIFEYLGARRPILSVGPKGDVVDELLEETGSGIVASEASEVKEILSTWLHEFRLHGELRSHYTPKQDIIRQYTRREQTRKLTEVLNEVVASSSITSKNSN
jgi:glycosyltransferase involved in cell wall biosynthesis